MTLLSPCCTSYPGSASAGTDVYFPAVPDPEGWDIRAVEDGSGNVSAVVVPWGYWAQLVIYIEGMEAAAAALRPSGR